MRRILMQCAIGLAILSFVMVASAQRPIAYPAKGQSASKQSKDEGACLSWARQSTGIDPATVSPAPPPSSGPAVGGGERLRGAARGALGGAAIGAVAGDAGEGAGVGAVVGTMAGGRRARENKRASEQQAQAQSQEAINTYYRAYGACMSGRGYTVN